MITVVSGKVTQFLEGESTALGPGDSVYIDKDVVHGSYNDFDEPAQLAVVLAPAVTTAATSRSTSLPKSPGRRCGESRCGRRGRRALVRDYPDPVAGPGEVVVELKAAAINRRDLLLRNPPGPAYEFDLPVIPGSDGAGIRRDTGEEVVIYPGLHWGARRGRGRAGLADPRRPANGTYAELVKLPEENVFPKPARLSWEEAAAFPLAALTAYRASSRSAGCRRRERAGPRRGQRRLDDRRPARARRRARGCSSPRPRRRRSIARRSSAPQGGVLYTEEGWAEAARAGRRRPRLGRDDLARVAEGAPPRAAGSSSSAAPAGPRSCSTSGRST